MMTTQTDNLQQDLVNHLRTIRDEINLEITNMSFEQERAWLDKLLTENECPPSAFIHTQ